MPDQRTAGAATQGGKIRQWWENKAVVGTLGRGGQIKLRWQIRLRFTNKAGAGKYGKGGQIRLGWQIRLRWANKAVVANKARVGK